MNSQEYTGIDAVMIFILILGLGVVNCIINAALVTFIVFIVVMPLVMIFPHWELAPFIHQHMFSLLVGVFVIQLIFPRRVANLPVVKLPKLYRGGEYDEEHNRTGRDPRFPVNTPER